jgi:D-threo-aldose 1-dehydrogenase
VNLPRHTLEHREAAITELSLGCAQLGNLYREVSDRDAYSTVDAAWDLGVRYFDTAPHYGLGLSERRLGAALRSRPRDGYVLSTKVGRLLEPLTNVEGLDDEGYAVPATHRRVFDFSRDGIRRSLSESLERLGLERVDVVYLHDPDNHVREVLDTGFQALAELRDEGAILAIGAGMNDASVLATLVGETDMDIVMLAGRYTLLEQDALDDLLPLCTRRGVRVIAAGVFNSGLLARAEPPSQAKYNYELAPTDLIERARAIASVCDRHGVTLPAAAIAFPLAHAAVMSVCVGARSAAQIERNADLFNQPIPTELWRELRAEGLLRDDAPMPR